MKAVDHWDGRTYQWHFEPDASDAERNREPVRMASLDANIAMPIAWVVDETHPDLVGLSVLLCVKPFVSHRLELRRGVSEEFAAAVMENLGIDIHPIDPHLPRRDGRVTGSSLGLAFSGDVHSAAALLMLPEDTVSVFLDRVPPQRRESSKSLQHPDAARAACVILRDSSRRVVQVATDLEHLRAPVGFPTGLASAVPLILLADLLPLDAVGWGTIAESSYRIGHARYQSYYERAAYRQWASLFTLVSLPIVNPVAGVSEVGTSTIVQQSGWSGVAHSCFRGSAGNPCRNCWKCFRKTLLDAAITDCWPSDAELSDLFSIKEAVYQLSKVPIEHENVVSYLCSKYAGHHPAMLRLARRVRSAGCDLAYLERWYAPSSSPWDEKYRHGISQKLDSLLGRMNEAQERAFESWDMSSVIRPGREKIAAESYGRLCGAELDLSAEGSTGLEVDVEAPTIGILLERERNIRRRANQIEKRMAQLEIEIEATQQSIVFQVGSLLEGRLASRRED